MGPLILLSLCQICVFIAKLSFMKRRKFRSESFASASSNTPLLFLSARTNIHPGTGVTV